MTGMGAWLAINTGSATVKSCLYDDDQAIILRIDIDVGKPDRGIKIHRADGRSAVETFSVTENHIEQILQAIAKVAPPHELRAVGHRIVHGGRAYRTAVRLTDHIVAALEALTPLAPLHQPPALAAIRVVTELLPNVPQIGCFDTAFHAGHADFVDLYALPRRYADTGVLRYGFHGLSYASIASRLADVCPRLAKGRTIVAHLGSGCSVCAMRAGRSVDSSMGFSALDGIPMGTRPGALDPGVLLYMMPHENLGANDIESILYKQSGLLGLSGLSADMREILASTSPDAQGAIAHFCFRTAREISALCTSLGGLDGLIFTAGIGEHLPAIRARIAAHLAWLGISLDDSQNDRVDSVKSPATIHAPASPVEIWVMPADEEQVMLREMCQLIDCNHHPASRAV